MCNVIEIISDSSFLYLQPWFYNNKLALRCELGIGEDKYMDNAFCRAIQIANILFDNHKIDAAFYCQYFDNDGCVHVAGDFGLYIDKTLELDRIALLRSDEIDDDISAVKRCISYSVDFAALERILKKQIECQNDPLVSFVSSDNQCIFSVYDDRGCDIVFFSNEKYKEFYMKLEQYFLDFDREKMRETFDTI
jgi:hypothetical protein